MGRQSGGYCKCGEDGAHVGSCRAGGIGGENRSDRRGFIPEDLYIQVGAR